MGSIVAAIAIFLALCWQALSDVTHEKCIKEISLKKDEIQSIFDGHPKVGPAQCYLACVFQAKQVMDKSGKFSPSGLTAIVKEIYDDPVIVEKGNDIAAACQYEVGTNKDKCVTAAKIFRCTKDFEAGFNRVVEIQHNRKE